MFGSPNLSALLRIVRTRIKARFPKGFLAMSLRTAHSASLEIRKPNLHSIAASHHILSHVS